MKSSKKVIEEFVSKYKGKKDFFLALLQDIQNKYNYLPEEVLEKISEQMDISLSSLYGIASFFRSFSLEPRGKHLITVCLGTACHIRGAPRIIEEIERLLGIKPGETTEDKKFTLETVNCLGCCAIGPLVVIDGKYTGKVTAHRVKEILDTYDETEIKKNN